MLNAVFTVLVIIVLLVIALIGELIWLFEKAKRNTDLIQQEWDAFSFGMSEEEKRDIVYEWSCEKAKEHGWKDVCIIPKL